MTQGVPGAATESVRSTTPDGGRNTTSETVLDAKGLVCPLPVLRLNRALRSMAPGERIRLLTTDRASVADVRAFCRETGHELTGFSEDAGGHFAFVVRHKAEPEPS